MHHTQADANGGESKINVELLEKVKAHILEEPRRFNMSLFVFNQGEIEDLPKNERPPCGTMACIAGWAVMLADGPPAIINDDYYLTVEDRAVEVLGLNEEQVGALFYDPAWPEKYADAYENARTPRQRARVAARRIDHFIKTNGAE
jgi:hypothetical protein